MSMTDPLADMLTRVVNAQSAGKSEVLVPASKLKLAVCRVLESEGYIAGFSEQEIEGKPWIQVGLKYFNGAPVIDTMRRVSTPGRRVYKGKDELPRVIGGLGIAVISTSRGVMSDREAREAGQGGEVLCVVS
ncbi:MAG: 30S ribosomal protein S8 [Methylotetracoccus sp.]